MGIVRNVLERLGFARLKDYGLILTPDRRVLTTRTRILDDGFGGRVVGWTDGDLATMELGTWGQAPVSRPTPLLPPPPPRTTTPPPVVATPRPVVATPVVATAPPAPAATPPAAAEPEEDEWEWEIAVARARAEAAEPQVAAAPVSSTPRPGPFTTPQWLTKEPLSVGWHEDTAIRPMERSARASEQMLAVDSRPRTIIPVPAMPGADPQLVRSHHDAVRRQAAPRRFPRASEQPIAAAANDHTSPTVSLPARQRAVGRR